MKDCLLIGNGLNRCLENSISWDNLLKEIAEENHVSYNGNISMPLEFESIVNEMQKTSSTPTIKMYEDIKRKIASKLSYTKLPDEAIHRELKKLSIDAIMTTNYDYLLEYVFNPSYENKGVERKKYLFDATSVQNEISFYHVHGFAANALSICLGYEHYMGIVEHLREELNTKDNNKPDAMRIKQVLFGEKNCSNHWGEKFYTDNIGIVGLGLTECEVDLWWLITHRAFLYYSNYQNIRETLHNTITYYDIINECRCCDSEKEKKRIASVNAQYARHQLLQNEHVIVRPYVLGPGGYSSYEEAYHAIIDDIQREGLTK